MILVSSCLSRQAASNHLHDDLERSRSTFHLRSMSVVIQLDQIAHQSMRLDETNALAPQFHVCISLWSQVIGKQRLVFSGYLKWPLEGSATKNFTWSINKFLIWSDSIHLKSGWSIKQGVHFCPLTYKGRSWNVLICGHIYLKKSEITLCKCLVR